MQENVRKVIAAIYTGYYFSSNLFFEDFNFSNKIISL